MKNRQFARPLAAAWIVATGMAAAPMGAWPQQAQAPAPPSGTAPAPAPAANGRPQVQDPRQRQGDLVLVGESATVEASEVINGDAVVIAGNLRILGIVRGDAVCVGGRLTAGPSAWIGGDLVTVGGASEIDPATKVMGSKVNVAALPLDLLRHLKPGDQAGAGVDGAPKQRNARGRAVAFLLLELLFFALLAFVALLLATFLPARFGRATEHIEGDFPRSALLGLTLMIALPPAVLVLAVTIFGIPLVPLLLLAASLGALAGYVIIAHALGRRLAAGKAPLVQTMLGLALLQSAAILGDFAGVATAGGKASIVATGLGALGALIFIAGSFLGLGAIVSCRFGRRTLAQSRAARCPNGPAPGVPPALR